MKEEVVENVEVSCDLNGGVVVVGLDSVVVIPARVALFTSSLLHASMNSGGDAPLYDKAALS